MMDTLTLSVLAGVGAKIEQNEVLIAAALEARDALTPAVVRLMSRTRAQKARLKILMDAIETVLEHGPALLERDKQMRRKLEALVQSFATPASK